MVGGLDFQAESVEVVDDLVPCRLGIVQRCGVEVPGLVIGNGRQGPILAALEEEELRLRSGHQLEAQLFGFPRLPLECLAGIIRRPTRAWGRTCGPTSIWKALLPFYSPIG